MQWRVMVELSGADGSVQTHEVHGGGCLPAACSAETLGLTRAQAKQLLAELQRHLVQAQTEEYWRSTAAAGAAAHAVRHRGGSCAPLRPLPMQCGPSPDPLAGWRDHARSLHT